MAPTTIRKAIGVVKDQTSIRIAQVASNMAPEMEVAVVRATSHDDYPASEKYLREILDLMSRAATSSHAYPRCPSVWGRRATGLWRSRRSCSCTGSLTRVPPCSRRRSFTPPAEEHGSSICLILETRLTPCPGITPLL